MEKPEQDVTTITTTSVEARTPWGGLRVVGMGASDIIVALLVLCGFGLLWYQSEANVVKFMTQHQTTQALIRELVKEVADGQKKAERASVVLTYVLTRDEKERKELRLEKPEELKR